MASRRDNGSGYIYERKDGKGWRGRIKVGSKANGKPNYVNFSGKTESEVKRKIRDYQKTGGTGIQKNTVTVGDYLRYWLRTFKHGVLKASSYDRLENTINHQIVPTIGDIQLQALKPGDIQKMITDLKSSGKAYSTVKKAYDCLNEALRYATAADDIVKNPMLLVEMPPKALFEAKDIRFFTKEESRLIVEEAGRRYSTGRPIYTYGDVFILILNTGMRVGEVAALMKADWNQTEKKIHVCRTIIKTKARDKDGTASGGYQLSSNVTKTYSGDRIIPLNENATEALLRLCELHPGSEYLLSETGRFADPQNIQKSFYALLNNIGLERTGVHSLRHTFASFLFAKKVDVKTISKILGHASIQITLNIYIHLIDNTDREAVLALDDVY